MCRRTLFLLSLGLWACGVEPLDPTGKTCSADDACPEPFRCVQRARARQGTCQRALADSPTITPRDDATLTKSTRLNGPTLQVQNATIGTQTSYLKFSVGSVAGAKVLGATLRLQSAEVVDRTVSIELARGAHDNWTELDLTQASAPVAGTRLDAFEGTLAAQGVLELDVTAAATADGVYTFVLGAPAGAFEGVAFHSRETSTPPRLLLVLGSP